MKILAVFILAWPSQLTAQHVLVDRKFGLVAHRAILVPSRDFNPAKAASYCSEFLGQPGTMFSKCEVATERYQVDSPPQSPAATFESWLRAYRRQENWNWRMAEAVAFNGGSVMRVRNESGKVDRFVLKDHDPLVFVVADSSYEIVHIDLVQGPGDNLVNTRVFVKASQKPDTRISQDVARLVSSMLPFREMTISIRNDVWFTTDPGFPSYHALSYYGEPPNKSDHENSPTAYCLLKDDTIVCRLTTVRRD